MVLSPNSLQNILVYLNKMENGEYLQKKLYYFLEQLQNMSRELPMKYQMRIPYDILASLANCLLNETIFEIVKGLMEIQHVTEEHLFTQRLQITTKQKLEEKELIENMSLSPQQKTAEMKRLQANHKRELQQFDMSIVVQLDQKVADQQDTLEKAGVPGFFISADTLDIKVQMYLLDFILRLSKMTVPICS